VSVKIPKSGKAYISTIKVMVSAEACHNNIFIACEFFRKMLSKNPAVIDWGHCNLNSEPCEVTIPKGYVQGDMFLRKKAPKKVKEKLS